MVNVESLNKRNNPNEQDPMKIKTLIPTLSCLVAVLNLLNAKDPFLGDWEGSFGDTPGAYRFHIKECYARVIPMGGEGYRVILLPSLDERVPAHFDLMAKRNGDQLKFDNGEFRGVLENGEFEGAVIHDGEWVEFSLSKTQRLSKTLNASPTGDAVVLFDGDDFDNWVPIDERLKEVPWKLTKDGAMEVVPRKSSKHPKTNLRTKQEFGDVYYHLEFKLPLEPENRAQGRANSGVFIQKKYEVQVLDSYGLEGWWNECGSIYEIVSPAINRCAPPEQWQTYDIIFRTPRFDENGVKVENAKLTVFHNGFQIHKDQEVPMTTIPQKYVSFSVEETDEPGFLWLQDHSNPVQFRNIWAVDLENGGKIPEFVKALGRY